MRKIFIIIAAFFLISHSLFGQHLKKDGSPDRRFKENRGYNYSPSISQPRKTRLFTTYGIGRNFSGRIKRSSSAKHAFMKSTGYTHGRTGYVVDHIIPLKRGGCDCPSNMQWQTKADAKLKDKIE